MIRKLLLVVLIAMIVIVPAWRWWRNQPNHVAERFLGELSDHVSMTENLSDLAARGRAAGLGHYFGPVILVGTGQEDLKEANLRPGNIPLQDLQAAYLGVLSMGGGNLTLQFSDIEAKRVDGILEATCRSRAEFRSSTRSETRDLPLRLVWNEDVKLVEIHQPGEATASP